MLSIIIPEWLMFIFGEKNIFFIAIFVPLPLIFFGCASDRFAIVSPQLVVLPIILINGITAVAIGHWVGISTVKLVLMWFVIAGGLLIFSVIYRHQIHRYLKVSDRTIGIKKI